VPVLVGLISLHFLFSSFSFTNCFVVFSQIIPHGDLLLFKS